MLTCCAASFACFFGSYLRIPVVPLYAAEIGASTAQVGAIIARFGFAAGFLTAGAVTVVTTLAFRTLYRRTAPAPA